MKYFKATFGVEQRSPTPWIDENGNITNRLPDIPGEHYGCGEELMTDQQLINIMSPKPVHDIVITELTEEEYIAAGHVVQ
jgi:hypothetical protein